MTKTSLSRISATALLPSLFLVMIGVASMRSEAGGSTTSAFAAQNTNKSSATKKPSTKTDCSKADDAALASQIKERLASRASLKNEKDINVAVKAGVATLTGKVGSKSNRLAAGAEAKKVKCVKKVVNNVCKTCPPGEQCCHGVCQTQTCPEEK